MSCSTSKTAAVDSCVVTMNQLSGTIRLRALCQRRTGEDALDRLDHSELSTIFTILATRVADQLNEERDHQMNLNRLPDGQGYIRIARWPMLFEDNPEHTDFSSNEAELRARPNGDYNGNATDSEHMSASDYLVFFGSLGVTMLIKLSECSKPYC